MPKTKADKLELAIESFVENVYVKRTPKYSWKTAMEDAGYADATVHSHGKSTWARAEKGIRQAKEKLDIDRKWDLLWIDQQYRDLHDECVINSDRTNAKGCLDSMSRRLSGFTDNINTGKGDSKPSYSDKDEKAIKDAARELNVKLSRTGSED